MNIILPVITHPAYILACALIGIAGRKRRLGLFGFTLLSFLITPILSWLLLFVTGQPKPPPDDEFEL